MIRLCFLFLLLFNWKSGKAQYSAKDQFSLEIRCFKINFSSVEKSKDFTLNFIIGLKNEGVNLKSVYENIRFGMPGDGGKNDIVYELSLIKGADTINLKNLTGDGNVRPKRNKRKISIEAYSTYFFEFSDISSFILHNSGQYKIRFTLLKEFAPEYMTQNIISEWFYFEVPAIVGPK